ncbi:MAG: hypothetical protein U9N38_04185 [Thermodesulfobacteriota bacterium]|nr:hypothetical protein [Thermodesulfobacteriota bacterium]
MLYADHHGNQMLLDRSAPGRYAPGDASIDPINMGGEKKREINKNMPQGCHPKPDNLTGTDAGLSRI